MARGSTVRISEATDRQKRVPLHVESGNFDMQRQLGATTFASDYPTTLLSDYVNASSKSNSLVE